VREVEEEFRVWWAAHDVRLHQTGTKHFRHPVVGLLDVSFDSMPLPAREDQDLTMTCYSAEPGSSSEDALKLLASWAATTSPDLDATAGEHAGLRGGPAPARRFLPDLITGAARCQRTPRKGSPTATPGPTQPGTGR
jgi:hypothetical protein